MNNVKQATVGQSSTEAIHNSNTANNSGIRGFLKFIDITRVGVGPESMEISQGRPGNPFYNQQSS